MENMQLISKVKNVNTNLNGKKNFHQFVWKLKGSPTYKNHSLIISKYKFWKRIIVIIVRIVRLK